MTEPNHPSDTMLFLQYGLLGLQFLVVVMSPRLLRIFLEWHGQRQDRDLEARRSEVGQLTNAINTCCRYPRQYPIENHQGVVP